MIDGIGYIITALIVGAVVSITGAELWEAIACGLVIGNLTWINVQLMGNRNA